MIDCEHEFEQSINDWYECSKCPEVVGSHELIFIHREEIASLKKQLAESKSQNPRYKQTCDNYTRQENK